MRENVAKIVSAIAGIALVAVAAVITFAVLSSDDDGARTALEPAPVDTEPETTPTTAPPLLAGGIVESPDHTYLIASLTRDVDGYDEPDGVSDGVVAATWHDRASHLAVIDQVPGWVHVRLPQRPNGSTAWVRRADVELTSTSYRIEIDVATMRLRLYDAGEVVLDAPAGIGTDEAPTTVGNFFVTFLQEPLDDTSGWGPFVVVTSSHSDTISDYQQSGDAIAAIHGPLGAAEEIGSTGAKVSNGCVRLHLDDLAALRDVPAGAPIDVIDSSGDGAPDA